MKIRSLMIPDPITVRRDASIEEAIELMKINSIRHLPVVRDDGRLFGFVTLSDLRQALIPAMVGDVALKDLIIRDPITVDAGDEIEIAAQRIYKHKIGGMPVVEGGRLVGIITATDILRAFIDMMGILTASSRIDVAVSDDPRIFQQVAAVITSHGGEIINVGMTTRAEGRREYYFRLSACKTDQIQAALEQAGFKVLAALD